MKPLSLLAFMLTLMLSGCASVKTSAPLIERAPVAKKVPTKGKVVAKEGDWRPQTYAVQKGDTLYGIALEHGFDYKEVAEWNGIEPPFTIRVGQQLKLAPAGQQAAVVVTPFKTAPGAEIRQADQDLLLKTQPKAVKQPWADQAEKPVLAKTENLQVRPVQAEENAPEGAQGDDDERIDWIWPTTGKVVAGFNEASSAKGMDIGGNTGQPVLAAAPGKVVYSGSGLRGYGKLVIIKHNKTYLSAYAHNRQILVKEGQSVTKGQKIAEMGDSDADQVKLHFEIRRLGKPVDPMKYLPQTTFHGLKPVESRSALVQTTFHGLKPVESRSALGNG
jgi:lipoprotein NlpD